MELVVAVISCKGPGIWLRGLNSVVKLLGGRVQSGWCRQVGWWHCSSSCCDQLQGSWHLVAGLELGRQAAWRSGCYRVGVVKLVGGIVQTVAVIVIACFWALDAGLELGRQAAWRPGCNRGGVVKMGWWHRADSCCDL